MSSRRRSTRRQRRQPLHRIPAAVIPVAADEARAAPAARPPRGESLCLPELPFLRRDLAAGLTILGVLILGLVVTSLVL